MEDFAFKLRNLKDGINKKCIIKIALIVAAIIFVVIILTILFSSNKESKDLNNVVLIKSDKEIIKFSPDDKGGLDIDNLDIKVYNLIDKNTNDITTNINLKDNDEEFDSEHFSISRDLLNEKIDEIMGGEEDESSTKININIADKTASNDVGNLEKLGNTALVKNLRNNLDVKPGVKVQLLAMKSQESLVKYWNELNELYPSLFSDKTYYVDKSNIRGGVIIYRLQVGNFDSYESADNFCEKFVKAANKSRVDCITIKS